jgi:hypothetical protein
MLFHQSSNIKSSLAPMGSHIKHSFTTVLVAGLLGIHLTLLAVGTFCASAAINSETSHHPDHESSTSILCSWACHVGQIAATATPTKTFSLLPPLIALSDLPHSITPSVSHAFTLASPRGPPLFSNNNPF